MDGLPAGVVEAKKEGETLSGYEIQTEKYSVGLPDELKPYRKPLPFCYQSTGIETRFTNLMEPDARSRQVFAFHRPETFADWLAEEAEISRLDPPRTAAAFAPARRGRPVACADRAIKGLRRSLAADRPRALIQMASGGGKTYTACNFCLSPDQARRRRAASSFSWIAARSARQAKKEFEQFTTPEEHRKFTELYNVQHLQSNKLDPVAKVCITTIQRLLLDAERRAGRSTRN